MEGSSRIARDWSKTAIWLGLAAPLYVGTYLMWSGGGGRGHDADMMRWVWSTIALAGALALTWPAVMSAGTAACPSCQLPVRGLRMGRNQGVLCKACTRYLEGTNGELTLMADDRVADSYVFAAPMPESIQWPPTCVLCARPPTRRLTATLEEEKDRTRLPFVALVTTVTHTLSVPHCAEHVRGVVLLPSPMGGVTGLIVVFKAQRPFRAFCELNGVSSVPL